MHIFLKDGVIKCLNREKEVVCQDLASLARQCNFRSQELALKLVLSTRQLQRLFKKNLAIKPSEWLKQQKMIWARQMFSQGLSTKYIAIELGYKYPAHFHRDFQKYFALTPYQFANKVVPIKFESQKKKNQPLDIFIPQH